MVRDTVAHLRAEGQRVFLDAEHFFDGYRDNRDYALEVLRSGVRRRRRGRRAVRHQRRHAARLGRRRGARRGRDHRRPGRHPLPQRHRLRGGEHAGRGRRRRHATCRARINGYGERTGNADLVSVVANLELKLDRAGAAAGAAARRRPGIAHAVAEVTNVPPASRQPYVGVSAFAHKAGLHASAIKVDPDLYQHIDPVRVGNDMRLLVSDMAGRASIELKGRELGFDLGGGPGAGHPGDRPGQGAGGRAGTPSRRPTRRSSCCWSRRSRAAARRTSTSSRGG